MEKIDFENGMWVVATSNIVAYAAGPFVLSEFDGGGGKLCDPGGGVAAEYQLIHFMRPYFLQPGDLVVHDKDLVRVGGLKRMANFITGNFDMTIQLYKAGRLKVSLREEKAYKLKIATA